MSVINPGPYPTSSHVYLNPTFFVNNVPVAVQKPGTPGSDDLIGPGPYPTSSGIHHASDFFIGNVPVGLHEASSDDSLADMVNPGPYPTSSDVYSSQNHNVDSQATALSKSP